MVATRSRVGLSAPSLEKIVVADEVSALLTPQMAVNLRSWVLRLWLAMIQSTILVAVRVVKELLGVYACTSIHQWLPFSL